MAEVDGNRTRRSSCFVVLRCAAKYRLSRANTVTSCCLVPSCDG
jgi:hypothetical protein